MNALSTLNLSRTHVKWTIGAWVLNPNISIAIVVDRTRRLPKTVLCCRLSSFVPLSILAYKVYSLYQDNRIRHASDVNQFVDVISQVAVFHLVSSVLYQPV